MAARISSSIEVWPVAGQTRADYAGTAGLAIAHQEETGRRLGEIFTEWDVITHQHLDELLHSQYNMRAAAMAVALLSPLTASLRPSRRKRRPVRLLQPCSS
jgi:cytosine/adenosine deaminase-related metal-dependent hydrolase